MHNLFTAAIKRKIKANKIEKRRGIGHCYKVSKIRTDHKNNGISDDRETFFHFLKIDIATK